VLGVYGCYDTIMATASGTVMKNHGNLFLVHTTNWDELKVKLSAICNEYLSRLNQIKVSFTLLKLIC